MPRATFDEKKRDMDPRLAAWEELASIDRSFVNGVETDRASATICSSVLGLAKSFGIASVAEGVETTAQLEWLRDRGCDIVQGFLLGRPMPFDAVLAHLESSRR